LEPNISPICGVCCNVIYHRFSSNTIFSWTSTYGSCRQSFRNHLRTHDIHPISSWAY